MAFPSAMAASALAQIRIDRIEELEVHLTGPAGPIGIFRSRIDDVSRALSGAVGRRVRAVLNTESAEAPADATESRVSITMEQAREHPLVLAAKKAFNAEIQRVDPAPRQPSPQSSQQSPQQALHHPARPSVQEHTP